MPLKSFVNTLFDSSNEKPAEGKLPAKVNQRLAHPKDPDAHTVSRENMKTKLCYKGHIAVDSGQARIITAAALTGGAISDQHLLVGLLSEHEDLVGRPRYAVADQKYGTTANFRILKVKGIKPVIVPQSGGGPRSGLSNDNFVYDSSKDVFICPAGNMLKPAKRLKGWKPYRALRSDCRRCPIRENFHSRKR